MIDEARSGDALGMDARERLPNEPPLLEPERAIRLAKEATAFFESPGDGTHELSRLAVKTAMDAAHLAIETAIDTGDPHVLDAALELATRRARGWGPEHLEHEITFAVDPIFPAVTEVDNLVRSCARSKSAFLRSYTARGLGPRALRSLRGESPEAEAEVDAEAAKIVFALTKDKDADVRGAARDALGGAAPPAWATFFDRDPLAKLPAAEAAQLRGPLDRAAEALEEGVMSDAAPLVEAIAELPDELAAPILEAWMHTRFVLEAEGVEPLLERWVELDPDGTRTAKWLHALEHRGTLDGGKKVGAIVARRSTEQALAFCWKAARILADDPGQHVYTLMNAQALLEQAWPKGADPTPMLEMVLGAPLAEAATLSDESKAHIPPSLTAIAFAPDTIEMVLEPMVNAFLAGLPGRWKRVAWEIEAHLIKVSDPRLRAHAEALLREGEGNALSWALRYLIQGGHDPSIDPPVDELLTNASRDPRLHAVIVSCHHLRQHAVPILRAELATGTLPPEEVISVARSIFDAEGSLSPTEYELVRQARDAAEDIEDRAQAIGLLPPFAEWTDGDRAFVDDLIDNHSKNKWVAVHLVHVLVTEDRLPDVPEARALLERMRGRVKVDLNDLMRGS